MEEEEDGKGQEGNRMKGRVEEENRWIGSRESEEEERSVKGQLKKKKKTFSHCTNELR